MMKKVIVSIISLIVIVAVVVGIIFSNKNNKSETIDDYYNYVNEDYIKELDEEESVFSKAQDEVDNEVNEIVDNLLVVNNQVNVLNKQLSDDKYNGYSEIEPYLDLINSSKDINEYLNNIYNIENELGVSLLMTMTVMADMKDSSVNKVYLYPLSFDFDMSCQYYNDKDYATYEAYLKKYGLEILEEYGYKTKEAREISTNLNSMFNNVCSKSLTNTELANYSSIYNVVTKEELKKIYSNIDVDKYLKLAGIDDQEDFVLIDKGNYETFNSYLTNDNLKLLKEYAIVRILESYSKYIGGNYYNIYNDMSTTFSNGYKDKNEFAKDEIKTYYADLIDKEYANNYYDKSNIEYINSITNDILSYYENDINNINWLSDSTKENAIKKLKNIKVNIGYPNRFKNYYLNYNISNENTLIENIANINNAVNEYYLGLLDKKENNWLLSITTVNAYYNPLDNSINIPASVSKLYDLNDDYYSNLGSVGMIIAHEITHAFDNNGALFDSDGNLNNWWTDDDYKNFNKLKDEVVKYYSNYELFKNIYVNGELTVGENIADLGALNAIVSIAESKDATNSDYKKMFTSYAHLWANNYSTEYSKILLLSDTHSPNKIRVNAVLSSVDKFYEVYNISKKDLMYTDKENRVSVW